MAHQKPINTNNLTKSKYIFAACLIFACLSCRVPTNQVADNSTSISANSIDNSTTNLPVSSIEVDELVESFDDDAKVGAPRKNKIEITCYNKSESERVVIRFYSHTGSKNWKLRQSLEFEKLGGPPCDPIIEDFNNDRLNDVTFVSGTAARGSNEIRTLLIYDKKRDELLHIKNSAEYPNLAYNSRLNCIDAWLVYGGTMTVFLRLKGDVLEEFASVENFPPNRTITVLDQKGKKKVIRRDKITHDDLYTRYRNFNPLEF